MSEQFKIGGLDGLRVPPSPHYVCPYCPFEGDEQDMIDHAMDCGHIARMEDKGSLLCIS